MSAVGDGAGHGAAGARTWRAPWWARAAAIAGAVCCLAAVAIGLYAVDVGAEAGPGAACGVAGSALLALICGLYAARSRVILTPETVVVVNALHTRTLDVREVVGVVGLPGSLGIVCAGRRGAIVGAAPLARWRVRAPHSHSGDIAHAILAAASRHDPDQ